MLDRFSQSYIVYILAVVAVGLTVAGQILVKLGMNRVGAFTFSLPMLVRAFTEWYVLLGFLLAFAGSVFWLGVVSRVPFSVAYPLLSMSYIFSVAAAHYVFAEQISLLRVAGTLVICVGIIMAVQR